MEPAATIIALFATPDRSGAEALSQALRIHRSTPYRWTEPKHKGGTGGAIPRRHHDAILAAAAARALPLTRAHLWADTKPDLRIIIGTQPTLTHGSDPDSPALRFAQPGRACKP